MVRRLLACAFILTIFQIANAQCTINARRVACVNDLVSFSITNSSGTILTYNWNFGAYGISGNSNPTVKFTGFGTVLVTCDLFLSGGGTCKDTHTITILPNPTVKTGVDTATDSCFLTNNFCVKNAFIKGSKGFQSLNLLWGDGNFNAYSAPLSTRFCHKFADTGTYSLDFELKDSAGCINTLKYKVHIVPSVVTTHDTKVTFTCDSSKICFTVHASGGKKLNYNWYNLGGKKVGTDSMLCNWIGRGGAAMFKYSVVNEYGCHDDSLMFKSAPDSIINFGMPGRRFCRKQIQNGDVKLSSNIPGEWSVNGQRFGTSNEFTVGTGKPGWNYVKVVSKAPCPSQKIDSFFMLDLHAHALAYNGYQNLYPKIIDTVWFVDISKNPPGSRMSRVWSFQDDSIPPPKDTTWTLMNKNVGKNVNYSQDSIAWHWYKYRCPVIVLTVFDSSTGCTQDTAFQISNADYCASFTSKRTICLGEVLSFDISVGLYKRVKDTHYILTDIKKPYDSIILDGPSTSYKYKTLGKKSPVFWRKYPADTVWTEKNGKIVIDFIRPARGWVADTFLNFIDVLYKPNAAFTVEKLGNCNPSKVRIKFNDTFWKFPEMLRVIWGDDSIHVDSLFTDTISKLPVLEHEYKKPGYYGIVAQLMSKNSCSSNDVQSVVFGYDVRFGPVIKCDNTICFKDTAYELGTKKYWDQNNGYGKLYWDFGDGKNDSGFSMCHTYSAPGTYKVKLYGVGKDGCWDTMTRKVVYGLAHAEIKTQPSIYCQEIRKYFDSSFTTGFSDSAKITKWQWDFGDGTNPVFVQNPVHLYPTGGTYTARLIITNRRGCKDTAYRTFPVIGPMIKAIIISDSLGCAPITVRFANLSTNAKSFIWTFGDQNNTFFSTKSDTPVSFKYTKSGTYFVHLTGGDSFYNPATGNSYYCTAKYPDSVGLQLRIRVTDGALSKLIAPDTICTYDSILFKNQGDTTFTKYFFWDFGNGHTLVRKYMDIKYQYPEAGKYKIRLYPYQFSSTKIPCADTAETNITVIDAVPEFTMDCGTVDGINFRFNNLTQPPNFKYVWSYRNPSDTGYKTMGYSRDMLYNFGSDTGTKIVCLRLDVGQYCAEKACRTVRLTNNVFLANVFTPGETDGKNDTYKVPLHGFRDFDLRIFNRWGELIFSTNDPFYEWNGKVMNTGAELPYGTYFFQLKYRDECGDGKVKTTHGSIMLIR